MTVEDTWVIYDNDWDRIQRALQWYGVMSGCAVSEHAPTPDMSVDVAAGSVWRATVITTFGAVQNVNITAANATLPRKDIVYLNAAGALATSDGVAAAAAPSGQTGPVTTSPAPPNIPVGGTALAEVWVAAATTAIADADITDRRTFISVDHGSMDGIADDDHTQYALRSILTTEGDIIYRDAANWARLAKGTAGYYLTQGAAAPEWTAAVSDLTVAETTVFDGASPVAWTDLDLSATIGANSAFVILALVEKATSWGVQTSFRLNGDANEYYEAAALGSVAQAYGGASITIHRVVVVLSDASGIIEWKGTGSQNCILKVLGYIK